MASGLRWSVCCLGGLIVIALMVVLLNPLIETLQPGPEGMRAYKYMEQFRETHEELQQLARLDHVRRALAADSAAPIEVLSSPIDEIAATSADLVRSIRAELSSLPHQARLGVFVVSDTFGRHPVHQETTWHELQFYTGNLAGRPFCSAVVVSRDGMLDRALLSGTEWYRQREPSESGNALGVCRLWAKYGGPSRPMERWLRMKGHQFADARVDRSGPPARVRFRRLPFGSRPDDAMRQGSRIGEACLAGRQERCVQAVTTQSMREVAPVALYTRSSIFSYTTFSDLEAALLAELEEEFGADRFARFWRAESELEPAFAAAFGVPLGEWVMKWAQRYHGVEPRGPTMEPLTLLLSLAVLGLMVGAAVRIGARRQVT